MEFHNTHIFYAIEIIQTINKNTNTYKNIFI